MTKRSESLQVLAFTGYFTLSMLLTTLILLFSLAAVKAAFLLAAFTAGAGNLYRATPLLRDSAGFALASALSVLAQYALLSLLHFSGISRRWLCGALLYTALFCGLFFWRFAAASGLGTYPLSGLPVMLACLLGGAAALTDKPGENPWPPSMSRFFL